MEFNRITLAQYHIKQVHWRANGKRDHLQCLTFEMRDGAMSPPKGYYKTNYTGFGEEVMPGGSDYQTDRCINIGRKAPIGSIEFLLEDKGEGVSHL